jgi:multidrug resistance efflux pump
MADTEVENILREIRERVVSQHRASRDLAARSASSTLTNGGNGAADPDAGGMQAIGTATAENLTLINSYLTTTARAWDRLPPVVSNRSGLFYRVELWLKRKVRRATRWFTWEQVNFNAAVHHALRDLLPLLSAYEQELGKLRARIDDEAATRTQLEARIAELLSELRERDEHLRDEQRVCFKQLALETSEAAVLEDRARRKAEAVLEELQLRIEQLEKK